MFLSPSSAPPLVSSISLVLILPDSLLKSSELLPTVSAGPEPKSPTSSSIDVISSDKPAELVVRDDSASFPRPKREVPLLPVVDARLPPALFLRPPVAPRVAAPPRDLEDVVPPDVPAPDLEATVRPIELPLRVAEVPPLTALRPPLELFEAPLLPPPLEACPPF